MYPLHKDLDPLTPLLYNQNSHTTNPELFQYPTHPSPTYTIESVTSQFTNLSIAENASPLERQFLEMVEACRFVLEERRMCPTGESANFYKTFSGSQINQEVDETDVAHTLLLSLFDNFSNTFKGLYHLYLTALYTLPLQSDSPFSAAFTHNGTFELQIRCKNTTRSLCFPHLFDGTIDPLTHEERSLVGVWFSYFMRLGEFATDRRMYEPFLQANIPEDCPFRCAFECEKALFSGESPSYDLYFDLNPLVNLNQFDVARMCAQFELRGQIGFDLHERALKENKSFPDIAWAFIQDSMRIAPLAIKRIAPKLIQEINDSEILFKWIAHALHTDKELARILLNHASMLTAEMKAALIQKLYKERDNLLFDVTIYATLLEGMLELAIVHSSLKNEAIAMYQIFFPKLSLYSSKEAAITRLAITLLCKDIDTTLAFLATIQGLAQSVLEALDRPELALEGSEVLLWHPDQHFESAIYAKTIDSHIQDQELLLWKNRFFEIAVEIMHMLLDQAPGSEQENSIRLDIVAKMIHTITTGNTRQTKLLPLFEKMTFSPLSKCHGGIYAENYKWLQHLYPILKQHFHLYPKSAYKIELIHSHREWIGSSALTTEEKLVLFNEVVDFQTEAKLPFALQRMCETMIGISKENSVCTNNDDVKIAALSKIINAALEMPYENVLADLHVLNGPAQFIQTNTLLLQCVINCMLTEDRQRITYMNSNASKKGYPLVEKLATSLIDILSKQEDHKLIGKFATLIFTLLTRAATNSIFASQEQFLELLKLCLTTPMLQKILQVEYRKLLIDTYYQLLSYQPPGCMLDPKKQQDLFLQLIKELLTHKDSTIFEMGRALFFRGVEEAIYHGELANDKEHQELMSLLNPILAPQNPISLPDKDHSGSIQRCCNVLNTHALYFTNETLEFWVKTLLNHLAKENQKTANHTLKQGLFLECTKRMKDPSIFTHKAITRLLSNNELKEAYANFLQGRLEQALITNSREHVEKAIALYYEFFPKLELQSPKEVLVSRMAIALFCKSFDPNAKLSPIAPLARCILKGTGCADELANDSLDILLYHADAAFTSPTTKKPVKFHIKKQNLLCWKHRLFEITKDFLSKLLERKPKNDKERIAQLTFVTNQIDAITDGNVKSKELVPVFEQMVFSILTTWNTDIYTKNASPVEKLYDKMLAFKDTYPRSIYKATWVLKGTEWEQCPLKVSEKISLFNELLHVLLAAKQPLALQLALTAMANISTTGSLFAKDNAVKIATLKKIIDTAFEIPYERVLARPNSEKPSEPEDIPFLKALIEFILPPTKQLITHDNKGGYPIVKLMTDKLVTLCMQTESNSRITTEEFIETLFCLWERAATHHIFETEAQYVDTLKLCLSTHLLKQILTTTSWEKTLSRYSHLVVRLPENLGKTSKALSALFMQYLQELNAIDDKTISGRAKEILNEVMKRGMSAKKNGAK